jgi:hypothetical protein
VNAFDTGIKFAGHSIILEGQDEDRAYRLQRRFIDWMNRRNDNLGVDIPSSFPHPPHRVRVIRDDKVTSDSVSEPTHHAQVMIEFLSDKLTGGATYQDAAELAQGMLNQYLHDHAKDYLAANDPEYRAFLAERNRVRGPLTPTQLQDFVNHTLASYRRGTFDRVLREQQAIADLAEHIDRDQTD